MKKICIFLFTVLLNIQAFSQIQKTGVLVIGGGAAGVAAGIQSARSGVKTIILEPGPWLGGSLTSGGMCVVEGNRNFNSGIWGEFRKRLNEFYKSTPGFDTASNAALRFEPATGAAILKKITDTAKNLTVHLNTSFIGIKKDGTGYEVTTKINGENTTIKADVVIDGTETADVAAKLGVPFDIGFESEAQSGEKWAPKTAYPIIQNITWIAILKDYGRAADRTIAKPEGYDETLYASLKGKTIKQILESGRLPNDKFMLKVKGVNDYPIQIADFTPLQREAAYKKARLRTLGLVYFLQTQMGLKNISVDNLEFDTPDYLPYLPYIREVRRAKGIIKMVLDDIYTPYSRSSKLYRTSIGIGDASPGQHLLPLGNAPETNYGAFPAYSIPAGAVIVKDFDNFLVAEKALSVTHLVNASTMYPSVQMTVGQGIGTIAAYCSFFKTTTKNIKPRLIQNEILSYKGYLMPFIDVKQTDPQFIAIQKIGVTGLLQGVQKPLGSSNSQVLFLPDSLVKTVEIKPVLSEIYTRSFLWFNKYKPAELFTIGNMLSFIEELNLRDAKTFQLQIKNDWKTKLHLSSTFDLNRPITRREFAALADVYLKPFDRRIDLAGKLLN